ncbi:MAG: Crp/Fnr family transcriptional regulator [Pseudomonadota bacterium]
MTGFPEGSTLARCGEAGIAALAKHWQEAQYPARALIVSDEDTDDDVFFILEGTARAATFTDEGKEVLLSDIQTGESFGILAAVDGEPRSTNVLALSTCRTARLSARSFNAVLAEEPTVSRAVILYLTERVRALSARMRAVTTLNAEQRLAAELLSLAGAGEADDRAVLEPLPTQQDLAALIFSQREAVGREMSKLRDLGLIARHGRRLDILDVQGLRDRAGLY